MQLEIDECEMMHMAEKMRDKLLSGKMSKQDRSVYPEMSEKEITIWFNVIESIFDYISTVDLEYIDSESEEAIIRIARQTYQKESGVKKLCPDNLDEWMMSDRLLWTSIYMVLESSLDELSDKVRKRWERWEKWSDLLKKVKKKPSYYSFL